MKVLVDTNIIIDILERREPFYKHSYRVIQLGLQGKLETIFSAASVTDVYYVISKSTRDALKAKEKIIALGSIIGFCDTCAADINTALSYNMGDLEDAVIAAAAKREKAELIITRNEEDFANSPVPAISPSLFLQQFFDYDEAKIP